MTRLVLFDFESLGDAFAAGAAVFLPDCFAKALFNALSFRTSRSVTMWRSNNANNAS